MDLSPAAATLAREIVLAYVAAPAIGPGARESWAALARGVRPLYQSVIARGITPVVSSESYPDAAAMFQDLQRGNILVDGGYVSDYHPLLTNEQRTEFMVVHDVLAHEMRLSYVWEDEVRAYHNQAMMLVPEAAPAVFAEIVAHASSIALDGARCVPYKGLVMGEEMRKVHQMFGWAA